MFGVFNFEGKKNVWNILTNLYYNLFLLYFRFSIYVIIMFKPNKLSTSKTSIEIACILYVKTLNQKVFHFKFTGNHVVCKPFDNK